MIATLVNWLKPFFVPLLKLRTEPPHLPEGSSLVRSLRPSEAWFTYRALTAMFGLLGQVIGTGVASVALTAKFGTTGLGLSALLILFQGATLGFVLVAARVDYELRHFLVGDRSLRVTEGALTQKEVTLSYVNVQNLEVTQGPLERLFGFQNLTVTTAGADQTPGSLPNSHSVTLVGLDDAESVRRLILGMLGKAKDSGLGEKISTEQPQSLSLSVLESVRDAAVALREAAKHRARVANSREP
jgi:membrane protein YdbS with pleckstrin-like domain